MKAINFDSHEFYSALVESGVAEKTANALTKAVSRLENAKLDELTTKNDLAETKADLIKTILTVGVCFGLTQLVAIFLLFMRITGKA